MYPGPSLKPVFPGIRATLAPAHYGSARSAVFSER